MNIKANFSEWHKAKLQEFLDETTPDPTDLRIIVRTLNVLPLMSDWNGCYAIQANGEIIWFLWDSYRDIRPETDPRIRNVVLFQGSKKYPELVPQQPTDAKICRHCEGTGIEPLSAKHGIKNINCYCGGLGWLPPES
jgi:hypothetical protein